MEKQIDLEDYIKKHKMNVVVGHGLTLIVLKGGEHVTMVRMTKREMVVLAKELLDNALQ